MTVQPTHIQHLATSETDSRPVCGAPENGPAPVGHLVGLCAECNRIALQGGAPAPRPEDLTQAERLGLVVAAAYGNALAERDMAVRHLRAVLDAMPQTSFAHTNAAADAAREWLEEYDESEAVPSPETPEQETTGHDPTEEPPGRPGPHGARHGPPRGPTRTRRPDPRTG